MPKYNDLTNQTFGSLKALAPILWAASVNRSAWWVCECVCGRHVVVRADRLKSGDKTHCGNEVHGGSNGRRVPNLTLPRHTMPLTHKTWVNIMAQKVVWVDPRWHKFEGFLEDMGERPSVAHGIRRRNRIAGYEPGNCSWYERKLTNGD
jgi:hypothetical protein